MGTNEAWNELVAVMARLRGPGGCPWDREQTHASLKKYIVEEEQKEKPKVAESDVMASMWSPPPKVAITSAGARRMATA